MRATKQNPTLFDLTDSTDQARGGRQAAASPANSTPKDGIEEIVGALCDPIIVFPAGGWEHDLPQPLLDRLPLDRLAHNMLCLEGKASWDEACDLEALIYLYPASLEAPMDHHWANIYLYLGTKCYGRSFPEDIKREILDQYDMAQLRELKHWIRKKKVEARKLKKQGDKVKAVQDYKYEQLAMEI